MKKRIMSLLMALAMMVGLIPEITFEANAVSFQIFNPEKAIEYADRWVCSAWENGKYIVNNGYTHIPIYNMSNCYNLEKYGDMEIDEESGGDCANFVSQCLEYAGFKYDETWKPTTSSWSVAYDLCLYLISIPNSEYRNIYGKYDNKDGAVLTESFIEPGTIVWTNAWNHVQICVGYDSAGKPIYNSHTADRYHYQTPFTIDGEPVVVGAWKYTGITSTSSKNNAILPEGTYTLTPKCATNMRLDVSGNSADDEANIQIYTANGTAAQSFRLIKTGNDYYEIVGLSSGKAVDVCGAATASGTNVWQYTRSQTSAQKWMLTDAGGGYYYIHPQLNTNLCLDVSGAGTTDETNVQVYTKNDSDAQKWKLTRVDATQTISVPAAPDKVTVTWENQSAMRAKVSWPAVSGATSYEVEYNHGNDAWRTESDYSSGTSFISTGVGHTSYFYRVRACNSAGKSNWTVGTFGSSTPSQPKEPVPAAPDKVTVTWEDQSAMKAKVSWPAVSGATSYEVEYNHGNDAWKTESDYKSGTSFISTGVGNTSYFYRVRAVNSVGKSDWTTGTFAPKCDHSAGYKTVKQSDGHYAAVCKNCGEEYILSALDTSTAGKYKVTGIIKLSREPYQEAKVNTTLLFGASVDIAGSLKNAYGNLWYKTTDGYWIYKDYLSKQRNQIERDDPNFAKINNYRQGQYSDVPSEQWFTNSVAEAYALGLMKGSGSVFNPYGDVTLAETVTMASRIHSIYTTGADNLVQTGSKWYQVYLDYALENGIIDSGYYNADVGVKVTRAQFAEIFAKALPDKALYPKNSISDNAIPDVSMSVSYAQYVYKLYRAGILTGGDALGTFSPGTFITRAEAATIVSRMAQGSIRKDFSL